MMMVDDDDDDDDHRVQCSLQWDGTILDDGAS